MTGYFDRYCTNSVRYIKGRANGPPLRLYLSIFMIFRHIRSSTRVCSSLPSSVWLTRIRVSIFSKISESF